MLAGSHKLGQRVEAESTHGCTHLWVRCRQLIAFASDPRKRASGGVPLHDSHGHSSVCGHGHHPSNLYWVPMDSLINRMRIRHALCSVYSLFVCACVGAGPMWRRCVQP